MSHLTNITHHGLFETSVEERRKPPVREVGSVAIGVFVEPERPFATQVDQTPEQMRATNETRYAAPHERSVANISPRHRGKHY